MDSFQMPFCARFPPKMRDGTQFWGARRALRPVEATSYEIDAEATQMQQVRERHASSFTGRSEVLLF
jgi:hypothetical protein